MKYMFTPEELDLLDSYPDAEDEDELAEKPDLEKLGKDEVEEEQISFFLGKKPLTSLFFSSSSGLGLKSLERFLRKLLWSICMNKLQPVVELPCWAVHSISLCCAFLFLSCYQEHLNSENNREQQQHHQETSGISRQQTYWWTGPF